MGISTKSVQRILRAFDRGPETELVEMVQAACPGQYTINGEAHRLAYYAWKETETYSCLGFTYDFQKLREAIFERLSPENRKNLDVKTTF